LTVEVITISGDVIAELEVLGSDTVAAVREEVSRIVGTPPTQQKLALGTTILANDALPLKEVASAAESSPSETRLTITLVQEQAHDFDGDGKGIPGSSSRLRRVWHDYSVCSGKRWREYHDLAHREGGRLPTIDELVSAGVDVGEVNIWVPIAVQSGSGNSQENAWANIGTQKYRVWYSERKPNSNSGLPDTYLYVLHDDATRERERRRLRPTFGERMSDTMDRDYSMDGIVGGIEKSAVACAHKVQRLFGLVSTRPSR